MYTRELLITGYAPLTWVKYLALHKSSITLNTVGAIHSTKIYLFIYFSRGFVARSRALRARMSRLRRSCARLDKTAMLRRLSCLVHPPPEENRCPQI